MTGSTERQCMAIPGQSYAAVRIQEDISGCKGVQEDRSGCKGVQEDRRGCKEYKRI